MPALGPQACVHAQLPCREAGREQPPAGASLSAAGKQRRQLAQHILVMERCVLNHSCRGATASACAAHGHAGARMHPNSGTHATQGGGRAAVHLEATAIAHCYTAAPERGARCDGRLGGAAAAAAWQRQLQDGASSAGAVLVHGLCSHDASGGRDSLPARTAACLAQCVLTPLLPQLAVQAQEQQEGRVAHSSSNRQCLQSWHSTPY